MKKTLKPFTRNQQLTFAMLVVAAIGALGTWIGKIEIQRLEALQPGQIITAKDKRGGKYNLFGLTDDGYIQFYTRVAGLETTNFPEDTGVTVIANMPVSSDSPDGSEMSYAFGIDSSNVMKIKASSDGAGGVDEEQVIIYGDLLVTGDIIKNELIELKQEQVLTKKQKGVLFYFVKKLGSCLE